MTNNTPITRTRFAPLRLLYKFKGWILFFVCMAFFRTAVADWNYVPSTSMEPTIYPGDVLWVNKMHYGPSIPFTQSRLFQLGSPKRGDIITFYPPDKEKQLVKRVIGIPGDNIRLSGQMVWVNGEKLSVTIDTIDGVQLGEEMIDDHIHGIRFDRPYQRGSKTYQLTVPDNRYFVLGDNRDNSADSRYWGFVEAQHIMGKVTHIALSIAPQRDWSDKIATALQ